MSIIRSVKAGVRRLFRPDAADCDLDDEVRDYVASATADLDERGCRPTRRHAGRERRWAAQRA